MTTSGRLQTLGLALTLVIGPAAHAVDGATAKGREAPLAPSALAVGNPADVAEARRCYQRATAHYNLQEYREAIVDFQQGYRLHPDSVFLYDIAQAHRLLGGYERALFFYRAYLRAEPEAVNRDEVRSRIQDLEAAMVATRRPPDSTLGPALQKAELNTSAHPDAQKGEPQNGQSHWSELQKGEPQQGDALHGGNLQQAESQKRDTQAIGSARLTTPATSPPKRTPIYKTWWFWTAGGIVVAGAVVGIAVAARPKHDEVLMPVNLGGN